MKRHVRTYLVRAQVPYTHKYKLLILPIKQLYLITTNHQLTQLPHKNNREIMIKCGKFTHPTRTNWICTYLMLTVAKMLHLSFIEDDCDIRNKCMEINRFLGINILSFILHSNMQQQIWEKVIRNVSK